jgi:hypothetical protein
MLRQQLYDGQLDNRSEETELEIENNLSDSSSSDENNDSSTISQNQTLNSLDLKARNLIEKRYAVVYNKLKYPLWTGILCKNCSSLSQNTLSSMDRIVSSVSTERSSVMSFGTVSSNNANSVDEESSEPVYKSEFVKFLESNSN